MPATISIEELERDPHPLFARLRSSEPVAWMPALGGWLVTRRDLALDAMRSPALFTVDDPRFSTGRLTGPSMLGTDGAEHVRHRAPFVPPFRLGAVKADLGGVVRRETERLIDRFEPRRSADLRSELAGPLAAAVVTHALGLTRVGVESVLGWYRAMALAVTEATAGQPLPAAGPRAFSELRAAIDAAELEPPPGLTRDELASNAAVILFGGIETTEGMIANAAMHLLTDADALAAVRADSALLPQAVEESLRLEPAAATVDRYATRAVEFGGASIEQGDLVTISIAAANRDPAAFDEPDRFDIRRRNAGRHLAFAAGPHVCIGMHLARLEAHGALRELLHRLPGLRLDPGEEPPAARGLVFRKPPELRVVW